MNRTPEINEEFRDLIPPLTKEEYEGLEESVVNEGCRESIIVWNDIIVDGHNRYEICKNHDIEFSVTEKNFANTDDAKLWIINNQFSRRNISIFDRGNLAIKMKSIIAARAKEKQYEGINQYSLCQNSDKPSIDTKKELATIAGISHDTIHRIETINNKASEETKDKIRRNELSINKAYKDIKNEEYKEKEAVLKDTSHIEIPDVSDRYKLYNCDILLAPIEDNSLDVIITDPPYPKEFLDCWDKLAQFAAAKLKDGGVLVAMSGQSYLPEVYKRMTIDGLNYYWTCCISTPGASANMRQKRLNSNWKPLLFYVKGNYTRTFLNTDIFVSEYKDTNSSQLYHKWGQSYPLTKSIVEKFTYANDVVCDPFAGGGTTLLASMELKRKVIGIEIDNTNYKTILDRIGDANDYTS
jgi:16S rRNA G966 N2-methylase RsmD